MSEELEKEIAGLLQYTDEDKKETVEMLKTMVENNKKGYDYSYAKSFLRSVLNNYNRYNKLTTAQISAIRKIYHKTWSNEYYWYIMDELKYKYSGRKNRKRRHNDDWGTGAFDFDGSDFYDYPQPF